jgi:hypothetical protein
MTGDNILTRVDNRPIADAPECRAFLPVRNERVRLPYVLDYHRRLGIARFFVVDNGSDDGTLELLLAERDCHVWTTNQSYAASTFGVDWMNTLLDRFGRGHWCLTIDADELFAYPGSETASLREFTRYLDDTGAQGVFAFLLDVYSQAPIANAHYVPGEPLTATCDRIDRAYEWVTDAQSFPPWQVIGGPRLRCFYPEWRALGAVQRKLRYAARRAGLGVATPPQLRKIPFVKWDANVRHVTSHSTTRIKLADVTGVLLHFKFLRDFHERVMREAARKEHFARGSEYGRYLRVLAANPRLSLDGRDSVTYEGTSQLVALGHLRDAPAWRERRTG